MKGLCGGEDELCNQQRCKSLSQSSPACFDGRLYACVCVLKAFLYFKGGHWCIYRLNLHNLFCSNPISLPTPINYMHGRYGPHPSTTWMTIMGIVLCYAMLCYGRVFMINLALVVASAANKLGRIAVVRKEKEKKTASFQRWVGSIYSFWRPHFIYVRVHVCHLMPLIDLGCCT